MEEFLKHVDMSKLQMRCVEHSEEDYDEDEDFLDINVEVPPIEVHKRKRKESVMNMEIKEAKQIQNKQRKVETQLGVEMGEPQESIPQ